MSSKEKVSKAHSKKTKQKAEEEQQQSTNLKPPNYVFGRPTKYEERFCEMLVIHMSNGYSYESFGGVVSVCKDTLYEWEKQHKNFSDAKKVGKSRCRLAIERMFKMQSNGKMKGSAISLIFFAKNVAGFRDDPSNEDDDVSEMEFYE